MTDDFRVCNTESAPLVRGTELIPVPNALVEIPFEEVIVRHILFVDMDFISGREVDGFRRFVNYLQNLRLFPPVPVVKAQQDRLSGFSGTKLNHMKSCLFKQAGLLFKGGTCNFHLQFDVRAIGFYQHTKIRVFRHIFRNSDNFIIPSILFNHFQPLQFVWESCTMRLFKQRELQLSNALQGIGQRNIEVCHIGSSIEPVALEDALPIKFQFPHRPTAGGKVHSNPIIKWVGFLCELGKWNGTN